MAVLVDPPLLGASSEEWLAYIQRLNELPPCREKQWALESLPQRFQLSERVRQFGESLPKKGK
jgi:hypothetical protein